MPGLAPIRQHPQSPLASRQAWARRLAQWAWQLGLLVLLLWAIQAWQARHVPGGAAPAFTAAAAVPAGPAAALSLAQWRAAHPGRPVALNFWAKWCPVCRLEQHNVTRVAADWPVLTVATQSGSAATVYAELARRDLPWPAVADPDGALLARYGLHAVPAFIVIAPDGRIDSAVFRAVRHL